MMDLRQLLLIETYYNGHLRDNDEGFPGAQGAYVMSEDGETILHVQTKRVVIPATEMHDRGASEAVDQLLWTAARNRIGGTPAILPGGLLETLRGQLSEGSGLQKLYAKPGTPAWDRAMAEHGDLPVIEALGNWGDWPRADSVVLGLPHPEDLGVSLQLPGPGGLQGLCVFPRFVAAVWVVS